MSLPMGPEAARRLPIAVRLLDSRLEGWGFPHRGSPLAAGLDLHACLAEPVTLAPGELPVLVPAGFAMRIGDPGWCAVIAPRSGLGHRGLVLGNTVGIIDADYEGEVLLSAWNRNATGDAITLQPGDRIAQLVFVRIAQPGFAFVEDFADPSSRGTAGFGSTGTGATGERP